MEAKHQKYKGRVVLRGDSVKDDSGSYAVFTEQGSSESQKTAAKIMDIISRLPGCDGQAADAVSETSRQAFGTHMVYRETFLQIQMRHHQHFILKNCINGIHRSKSRFTHPQWRRVRDKHKIKIRDASLDSQPKIQSSSVEGTLQRIMEQTNNDCRFRIFISTNSVHQPRLLAGR